MDFGTYVDYIRRGSLDEGCELLQALRMTRHGKSPAPHTSLWYLAMEPLGPSTLDHAHCDLSGLAVSSGEEEKMENLSRKWNRHFLNTTHIYHAVLTGFCVALLAGKTKAKSGLAVSSCQKNLAACMLLKPA